MDLLLISKLDRLSADFHKSGDDHEMPITGSVK